MKNKTRLTPLLFLLASFSISAQINFIEDTSQSFEVATRGNLKFADIDNDGDQDLLTTGLNSELDTLTTLYTNDGLGNYTKVTNIPFEHMIDGAFDFGDIDNDGDQDLIMSGLSVAGNLSTQLFTNNGLGNFEEVYNAVFEEISKGKIAFADLDNDGDEDLVLSGFDASGGFNLTFTKVYFNGGLGTFSAAGSDDFTNYGTFDIADVDGDDDLDILISGPGILNPENSTTLYLNDGDGDFSEILNTPLIAPFNPTINFADIDGDSDMDVLITGLTDYTLPNSKLYINDGEGNFIEVTESPISVYSGACGFTDLDADQDVEMFITGQPSGTTEPTSTLFSNDGNGLFTEVSNLPFIGIKEGALEFVDVDGDSDMDLFITGIDASGTGQTKLYLNDFALSTTQYSFTFPHSVFPNPFDEYFSLNFDKTSGQTTIALFDILGQMVLTRQVTSLNEIKISTSDLQSGLYFLKVKDETGKFEIISICKK